MREFILIGLYMCVHIIQRYDDTMREKGGEGRERRERDTYINQIYRVGPLLSAVLYLGDNTRCCYMLVHKTRMHPGTCGLTTHAHTPPRLNTRACMRTHTRFARTQAHSCTHPHNAHACIRSLMREHTSTCARTRATTYIFGCVLTDWGHTPQLWFVFRKTLSLFGCLALFVLHSHGLASGGNAGGCGWVASPAGVCGNGGAA